MAESTPKTPTPSADGFPYQFMLGTTGIRVDCTVILDNGLRTITSTVFSKAPMYLGDSPRLVDLKDVDKVWKQTNTAKYTGRSVREEIERVTQAVYS